MHQPTPRARRQNLLRQHLLSLQHARVRRQRRLERLERLEHLQPRLRQRHADAEQVVHQPGASERWQGLLRE